MALPISIKQLLETDLIESERLELKKGFNPIKILHTMCAFANDFNNWGGGYIIIGVKDNKEVIGLNENQIDPITKKIIELSNKIHYPYFPRIEPVKYKNNNLIILYCPTGQARPYKTFKSLDKGSEKRYYIKHGSTTVLANTQEEQELIGMSNKIPYDDQINHNASMEDLDINLIKSFLKETNSDLNPNIGFEQLCISLNIADGPKEDLRPKNIGLLMFSSNPEKYFKKAQIDIITFYDDIGDKFDEEIVKGDLKFQIKRALQIIKTIAIKERVQKIDNQAEAKRFYSYPYSAIEEALVNAIYHKSYEEISPVEVRINKNEIIIISHPGPLPPLNKDNLNSNNVLSRRYRNSRIGDFLKELDLSEGRNTGFTKIRRKLKQNGSPKPIFETDKDRVYFITKIKIHPDFKNDQVTPQVTPQVDKKELILQFCITARKRDEIQEHLGLKDRENFRINILKPLLDEGLLELTIPDKPTSSKQKYRITKK